MALLVMSSSDMIHLRPEAMKTGNVGVVLYLKFSIISSQLKPRNHLTTTRQNWWKCFHKRYQTFPTNWLIVEHFKLFPKQMQDALCLAPHRNWKLNKKNP